MAVTELEVLDYMEAVLGPIKDAVKLTNETLVSAARLTRSAYMVDTYAEMTNELKWKILAEFFALNYAVNYATQLFKFTADDTTVDGSSVFQHIQDRWRNALAMAQSYLMQAGIAVVAPGAPINPHNYGYRIGQMNLNYLDDDNVTEYA